MPIAKLNNERTVRALKTTLSQEDFRDETWTNEGTFGCRVTRAGRKGFFLIYGSRAARRRFTLEPDFPVLSLAKAKSEALQIISRVAKGEDPQEEKQAYKVAETVSEIFELYIRHREDRIAKTTVSNFRSIFKKDVEPKIGGMKAVDVKKVHIIDILNHIAFERESPVQSNRTKDLMSAFFRYAVDQAILEYSPCFGVKDVGIERVGERYLSSDEIKTYWQKTEVVSAVDRAFLRLLLLTGMRPGEVMKLQWSFIDDDVLTLPSEIVKTRNQHELYLAPLARSELKRLRAESDGDKFLFPALTGNGPRRCFQEAHRNFLARMESEKWTLRDIRRTVETHMRRIGISGLAVNEILNHARGEIRRHYDKNSYFPEKKVALIKWAEWIESTAYGREKAVVNLNDYR